MISIIILFFFIYFLYNFLYIYMSNLICKENFNWKKYVDRYKDLKSINNIDLAWNHWCEEGRKQGRKFFTLTPYKASLIE